MNHTAVTKQLHRDGCGRWPPSASKASNHFPSIPKVLDLPGPAFPLSVLVISLSETSSTSEATEAIMAAGAEVLTHGGRDRTPAEVTPIILRDSIPGEDKPPQGPGLMSDDYRWALLPSDALWLSLIFSISPFSHFNFCSPPPRLAPGQLTSSASNKR